MEAGIGTIQVLQALKGLGVLLAIDDFGTGYSSLAYLKRFPVDTLKVDRSVRQRHGRQSAGLRDREERHHAGQTLGLSVTAEGIETVGQLDELRGFACTKGQGFLFARPVPAEAFTDVTSPAQVPCLSSPRKPRDLWSQPTIEPRWTIDTVHPRAVQG